MTEPLEAVSNAGADIDIISLEKGEVEMWQPFDKGDTITADHAVADADASDYDGLVLPGGVANPDPLRTDDGRIQFVRAFFEQDKPVGVICHGPWMLVEAGRGEGPQGDVVAKPPDRSAQRRRGVGRRGGRRRQRAGHEPQAR